MHLPINGPRLFLPIALCAANVSQRFFFSPPHAERIHLQFGHVCSTAAVPLSPPSPRATSCIHSDYSAPSAFPRFKCKDVQRAIQYISGVERRKRDKVFWFWLYFLSALQHQLSCSCRKKIKFPLQVVRITSRFVSDFEFKVACSTI